MGTGAGGVRVSASYACPRVSYTGVCSYDLLIMRKKDDTLLYLSPEDSGYRLNWSNLNLSITS